MEKTDITEVLNRSFSISIDAKRASFQKKIFSCENIPIPRFFPGYTNKSLSNIYRCSLSHESVIKTAKTMGFPNCFVFEDDAYPKANVLPELITYLKDAPEDFDILIFGWSKLFNISNERIGSFRRFIPRKSTCYGAHSYVVSEKNYDRIIRDFENNDHKHADNFFEFAESVYVTELPMFIQYSFIRSMNNHIGYILNGDHSSPPPGFSKIEKYISGIK